jgi:hypothetical protein
MPAFAGMTWESLIAEGARAGRGSDVASQHGGAEVAIAPSRQKLSVLQSLSWQGLPCPHLILRKGAMPPTGY